MMTRLRRASAIVALSLLACAATASAECAWVLWLEVNSIQSLAASYPSYEKMRCSTGERAARYRVQRSVAGLPGAAN